MPHLTPRGRSELGGEPRPSSNPRRSDRLAAGPASTPQPAPSTAQKAASLDVTKVLVVVEIDPAIPFPKSAAQDPALKDFGQANRGSRSPSRSRFPSRETRTGNSTRISRSPASPTCPSGDSPADPRPSAFSPAPRHHQIVVSYGRMMKSSSNVWYAAARSLLWLRMASPSAHSPDPPIFPSSPWNCPSTLAHSLTSALHF